MAPRHRSPSKFRLVGSAAVAWGCEKTVYSAVADFDAVYAWAKTNPKVIEAVEGCNSGCEGWR